MERVCVLSFFSNVLLFATLCTIAHQAPLSIGLEQWSGLPCPSPGIFPTLGWNLHLFCLPAWQVGGFFTTSTTWEAHEELQYTTKQPMDHRRNQRKKYLETNGNENNDSKSMKYRKSSTQREAYICKSLTQETRKI